MSRPSREALARLAAMPPFLEKNARRFTEEDARRKGPDGAFSFVENVWHLADLEREGYGARIERLRGEDHPRLSDFDGARVARERDYQSRPVAAGLAGTWMRWAPSATASGSAPGCRRGWGRSPWPTSRA
jgi:hypothetical protein